MASKKVTISLSEAVLENIEAVAEKMGMSRSATITMLLWNGIQMALTPELIKAMENLDELKNSPLIR